MDQLSWAIEPGIAIIYAVIALDFYKTSKDVHIKEKNKDAAKAVFHLSLIFILCGITRLFHYIDNIWVQKISLALHIFLLIFSILYYLTNQNRKIMKAFE